MFQARKILSSCRQTWWEDTSRSDQSCFRLWATVSLAHIRPSPHLLLFFLQHLSRTASGYELREHHVSSVYRSLLTSILQIFLTVVSILATFDIRPPATESGESDTLRKAYNLGIIA